MRSMMLRQDPFGNLLEEILSPVKNSHRRAIEQVGTRENPTIITRREWVERKFNAWEEEDGSYHEELIVVGVDLPTGKEGTD